MFKKKVYQQEYISHLTQEQQRGAARHTIIPETTKTDPLFCISIYTTNDMRFDCTGHM